MADDLATPVRGALRAVPDFPQPGVLFRDITPLLAASSLFPQVVAWLAAQCEGHGADRVACIESRGFLFGAPLAERLGLPLALIRKPRQAAAPHRAPGTTPWSTAPTPWRSTPTPAAPATGWC